MFKKLTIFLKVNILLLFISGCCTFRSDLTEFPPSPNLNKYTKDPVISYNNDSTYTVTDEMVENSLKEHLYIKAILDWKNKNNIQ